MKKILYLLPFFFLFFFIATPSFAQDNCSVTPDKTTITASTPTTVNLTVVNNTAYPSDIHMSISQFILTNSYGQTPYAIGTASPLTWIREANGLAIDANYRGDTWVPYSYGDYISSNGGYETLPYLFNLPPGTFHFDTYTPTHSVLLDCGGIDLTAIGVGINPIPNAQIRGGDTFSASDSYTDNEPNATSWTATVDYGNGSGSQPLPLSGTNFSLSHVYTDTGRYTVTVTVTDDQGATATQTTQVFVNIPTTINTVALSPGVTRIYYTFYNTLNINPDLYPNINLTYLRIDYNANIVTPIDSSISIASLDHTCNCGPDYTNDLIVNNLNVAPNDTLTFWVDWQGVSAGTSHIRYQLLSDNVDAYLPGLDIGYTVVANTPPSVGTISVSPNPVQVNTQTFASATFTDPDTSDTHTAVWDWGDGNTSQGTITEPNGSTPGTVTGTHTYTSANVYTVKLTVTDNHNGAGDSTYKYVSVYNPTSQGLFSAGHLFSSPTGAYPASSSLTGNVTFGLVYKYQGTMPTSDHQFTMNFKAANLTFNATTISSLVVANNVATLTGTGTGTINGVSATYNFLVVGVNGGNIRVQITDPANNNAVIYDTQPGAAATATPTTSVTGNVIAHN